jgi:hypothetical protein
MLKNIRKEKKIERFFTKTLKRNQDIDEVVSIEC